MAASDSKEDKARSQADRKQRLWQVISAIPSGRVCSYGEIAKLAGLGRGARQTAWALNALDDLKQELQTGEMEATPALLEVDSQPPPAKQARRPHLVVTGLAAVVALVAGISIGRLFGEVATSGNGNFSQPPLERVTSQAREPSRASNTW